MEKIKRQELSEAVKDELDAIPQKIPATEKGAASGVATLDAGSKVPVTQVPDQGLRSATTQPLFVEVRDTNPATPTIGQMWLRSDL